MTRRSFLYTAGGVAASAARSFGVAVAPTPYGALPSKPQIEWASLEYYNFLHFTVNTFTGKEWGYGDESPALFNPSGFDAEAIVEVLKDSGSKGVILTCKHHDGFCLWPTRTTEHSIKNSPYKEGKGDIVRELSEAAQRHNLKFGVYVSPWDRSQGSYGAPKYVDIYRAQLQELLSEYGPIFEIWHDGANGGDGYYGGAREKRIIDRLHYYRWQETWLMERRLQPAAVRFSDAGPDIRWVGNEKGIAGETCWATFTPVAQSGGPGAPGDIREQESSVGTRNGKCWMPAECDVSIRPGWFWHEAENTKVKAPRELLQLYYDSVGRGASFLLNVPPDRRGLIYETDANALREFGKLLQSTFRRNLAATATATASSMRGADLQYGPQNLLDGRPDTYWTTEDSDSRPEAQLEFARPVRFNLIRLREYIPLGQRISAFKVDFREGEQWSPFGAGTSIGMGRILRSEKAIIATRLRLRITDTPVVPALSELGLFLEEGY